VGPEDGGVFSGVFDHAIDDKGRVSIPARFREVLLREKQDLSHHNFAENKQRCLELFPPTNGTAGRKNSRRAVSDPRVPLSTFYIAGAHEVQVANSGRILIPPKLREVCHNSIAKYISQR